MKLNERLVFSSIFYGIFNIQSDVMLSLVSRIQLKRSIPSVIVTSKAITLQIICCEEFAKESGYVFDLYYRQMTIMFKNVEKGSVFVASCKISQNRSGFHHTVDAPDMVGKYQLIIQVPSNELSNNHFIMSYVSDCFDVVSENAVPGVLLMSYREFVVDCGNIGVPQYGGGMEVQSNCSDTKSSCDRRTIIIEEEYMATIGSSIWDSAIILSRELLSLLHDSTSLALLEQRRVVVELGAGCGLNGLLLAPYYSKVYLTDKANQIPYTNRNIELNKSKCEGVSKRNSNGCVKGVEMDWTSPNPHDRLDEVDQGQIDLIIAADVLYDSDVMVAFFNTVSRLCRGKQQHIGDQSSKSVDSMSSSCEIDNDLKDDVVVIIAQKNRNSGSGSGHHANNAPTVDVPVVAAQFGFKYVTLLREEGNVFVWCLKQHSSSSAGDT